MYLVWNLYLLYSPSTNRFFSFFYFIPTTWTGGNVPLMAIPEKAPETNVFYFLVVVVLHQWISFVYRVVFLANIISISLTSKVKHVVIYLLTTETTKTKPNKKKKIFKKKTTKIFLFRYHKKIQQQFSKFFSSFEKVWFYTILCYLYTLTGFEYKVLYPSI